jgi:hypothetical protein
MYQCKGLVYAGGGDVVPLVADVDEAMFCGGVDELLPLAQERLGATKRVLTDEERRLYVG